MASLKHYVDNSSARGINDTVIDQLRAKYHTGSYAELKLYFLSDWKPTEFLGQPHNPQVPVYGLCNYATEGVTPLDRATDGCVINQIALPGSKTNPEASFGYTAVHEVGHWLGLLHPWGSIGNVGGCVRSAGLEDVPTMKEAVFGCPAEPSQSCPGQTFPFQDPLHNFMGYTDDCCLYEFTEQQTLIVGANYAGLRIAQAK